MKKTKNTTSSEQFQNSHGIKIERINYKHLDSFGFGGELWCEILKTTEGLQTYSQTRKAELKANYLFQENEIFVFRCTVKLT